MIDDDGRVIGAKPAGNAAGTVAFSVWVRGEGERGSASGWMKGRAIGTEPAGNAAGTVAWWWEGLFWGPYKGTLRCIYIMYVRERYFGGRMEGIGNLGCAFGGVERTEK